MSRVNDELESMTRRNKIIWEQTYRLSDSYKTEPGKIIDIFDEKDLEKINEYMKSKKVSEKVVKVVKEGQIQLSQIVAEKGVIPLVVNCGSQNDPTRTIESGPIGPEWDLMRRSNICNAISPDSMYPIRQGRSIYFPSITIFRSETYTNIKPFKISVLTILPISSPGIIQTQNNGKITESYENIRDETRMRECIERIFQTAMRWHHNCIIINDFGIAQNNPVFEVIKIFNEMIEKYPIHYVFFAIQEPLLDRLKNKSSKRKQEYEPFKSFHSKIRRKYTISDL